MLENRTQKYQGPTFWEEAISICFVLFHVVLLGYNTWMSAFLFCVLCDFKQGPSLKRTGGSCITPVPCLGQEERWFWSTERCVDILFFTARSTSVFNPVPFPPRFTYLTSTFREKSASRSLRLWALATVCPRLTHVEWRFLPAVLFPAVCTSVRRLWLLSVLLMQLFAKWVWGSAMTWGLQSSLRSTAEKVSVWDCWFSSA